MESAQSAPSASTDKEPSLTSSATPAAPSQHSLPIGSLASSSAFVHLLAAAAAAQQQEPKQSAMQQQQQQQQQQPPPSFQQNPYSMLSTPGVVHPLQISTLAHLHHTNVIPSVINDIKHEEKKDTASANNAKGNGARKRKAILNKRKVSHACVYCRRSHMTCDDGRPCQRCIKRKIAHLCHDDKSNPAARSNRRSEPLPTPPMPQTAASQKNTSSDSSSSPVSTPPPESAPAPAAPQAQSNPLPVSTMTTLTTIPTTTMEILDPTLAEDLVGLPSNTDLTATMASALATLDPVTMAPSSSSAFALDNTFSFPSISAFPPLFASESMGHEFAILSDFLASWDGSLDSSLDASLVGDVNQLASTELSGYSTPLGGTSYAASATSSTESLLNGTKLSSTERFILTAADPKDGSSEDRLRQVISAKIEAGLLKPYNYISGYTRLQKWMDTNMPAPSRQRILNVMGTFRPMFRSIAQSLTDYDLVMVEEAFERLLLEYDRVFSSMGIPACLWRRTGEIWKSNKEFAALVGVPIEQLKDGKTCIYELMNEESAVNYWEKYGNIAFDAGQKAVLTSCVLRSPDSQNTDLGNGGVGKEVQCCFSFTIRRDKYNIPLLIAGNFLIAS